MGKIMLLALSEDEEDVCQRKPHLPVFGIGKCGFLSYT